MDRTLKFFIDNHKRLSAISKKLTCIRLMLLNSFSIIIFSGLQMIPLSEVGYPWYIFLKLMLGVSMLYSMLLMRKINRLNKVIYGPA